jgi:hypothetical protein
MMSTKISLGLASYGVASYSALISIDHPRGLHDDIANAVAGVLTTAFVTPGVKGFGEKITYGPSLVY